MILIHHDQWPGLVVQLQDKDSFAGNTNNGFGLTSAGGDHGLLADVGTNIFQVNGVSPLSKWVDDHIFFHLPHQHLEAYNAKCHSWSQTVAKNGGRIHEGSRIWYEGDAMPDGCLEEFDKDMVNPLHDLADATEHPPDDALFTYADANIKFLFKELGIPWASSKTIPFAMVVPYLGFLWDLDEVLVMPHIFLPESSHSGGFRCHSSGIYQPKFHSCHGSLIFR